MAGRGSDGDRERVEDGVGPRGMKREIRQGARNGVLRELSTTTCDRCPSRD